MKTLPKTLTVFKNLIKKREYDEEKIIRYFIEKKNNDLNPEIKLKILEILKNLVKRAKIEFGMLIVYGWKREWNKIYASILDETQNLFETKDYNLRDVSLKKAIKIFTELREFDGAILINKDGKILASGAYLINLNPLKALEKLHKKGSDLSDAFGFKSKVHTRHIIAITTSTILDETTVYTVSEENSIIRIYEKGEIVYSTFLPERKEILEKIESNS